jgi:hypothetical protein
MKRTVKAIVALALALSPLACDSGGGEYVKKMEEFAEQACACKDAACASKVSQDQGDWLTKNAEKAAKLSAKDAEKVTAAASKLADCMSKAAMK